MAHQSFPRGCVHLQHQHQSTESESLLFYRAARIYHLKKRGNPNTAESKRPRRTRRDLLA